VQAAGLTACDVKRCHDAGLQVAAWTVNSEADYRKYGNWGVYMMTCDYLYPDQMPELSPIDWDDLCPPVLDTPTVYVTEKYNYTLTNSSLPTDFPTGSSVQAQQAAWVDGVFYGNDYVNSTVYAYDANGTQLTSPMSGTVRHGICRDDAGHLILHSSPAAASPTELLIYRTPTATPDTISFSLPHDGQTNFPTAMGDIYSEEGGYVYFYPNKQKYVDVLKFQNGELTDIFSTGELSLESTTAGYVIPLRDGDPMHFIYQVRANGYYLYKGADKGAYFASSGSTKAPNRNNSIGGAYFRLGEHVLFLYNSGTNYNGGWAIRDMSAGQAVLYTQAPLGSAGYQGNPSCGSFYQVERVDSVTIDLYEWCLGNGYAAWRISLNDPSLSTSLTTVSPSSRIYATAAGARIEGEGRLDIAVFTVSGVLLTSLCAEESAEVALPSGIYLIRVNESTHKLVK